MTASRAVFASLLGRGVAGEYRAAADVDGPFAAAGAGLVDEEERHCRSPFSVPSPSTLAAAEDAVAALVDAAVYPEVAVVGVAAVVAAAAFSELLLLSSPGPQVLRKMFAVVEDLVGSDLSSYSGP